MTIESPKIENQQEAEKETPKEKLQRRLGTIAAWGLISTGVLGASKVLDVREKNQYKPKAVISRIEKKQPIVEKEKTELNEKIEYLLKHFGPEVIASLESKAKEAKNAEQKPIKVQGFEKMGVSSEKLKQIWSEKYYPKGWVDGEALDVEYREKQVINTKKNLQAVASYSGEGTSEKPGTILFFKVTDRMPKDDKETLALIANLDSVFSHELGHANEWGQDEQMSFKQRLDFLFDVSQKFSKSTLDDGIATIERIEKINMLDKQKEWDAKVSEYWAYCCNGYFNFPEVLKQTFPSDFEMVDKYVKMEDANYNPVEKQAQKQEVIKQMAEKEVHPVK